MNDGRVPLRARSARLPAAPWSNSLAVCHHLSVPPLAGALQRIETYYDAVPRAAARVEDLYPFTLFVKQGAGWPYYARPARGTDATTVFTPQDVERVRERQRALDLPEAFEWVLDISPGLRAAVEAAGLHVHTHPLMLLDPRARQAQPNQPVPVPSGLTIRLVPADEAGASLARLDAVAHIGFQFSGTATGEAGLEALTKAASQTTPQQLAFRRERLRAGRSVVAVAETPEGPVCVGSHQPLEGVTEIVGVATLPAFRRQGIGAALVDRLVEDAIKRGVTTIFLSAGDAGVARIYARLGFRTVATACIAEPEG
ncbi:MAG TPA: GNAT family N-acetyltransferase [Chloroflexota bacterium]|nr:GNAT family N-acetyltransferase [Chloroflexota bacterium]